MPAIFTDKMKDDLYRRMVDAGWEILRERGIRSLRVEEVTRAVGIAKGTFYSFFPSKERFVYAMMEASRQEAMDALDGLRDERGRVRRDGLRRWLRGMWRSERNIYRLLSCEEYELLMSRLPGRLSFDPEQDGRVMGILMESIDGVREGADWRVVANLQKGLALMLLDRAYLHEDALDASIDAVVEAMLDELFGR